MMQAMLLGDHVEPSYTSRVSRLLGVDGESVFLASISDSFCDAERTLKILGHFTPILAEYVVTMRTVSAPISCVNVRARASMKFTLPKVAVAVPQQTLQEARHDTRWRKS